MQPRLHATYQETAVPNVHNDEAPLDLNWIILPLVPGAGKLSIRRNIF